MIYKIVEARSKYVDNVKVYKIFSKPRKWWPWWNLRFTAHNFYALTKFFTTRDFSVPDITKGESPWYIK